MLKNVIISGCSGGGKSSVIAALAKQGYKVIEEPGRRIVQEEAEKRSTKNLPWVNPVNFARRAIELSLKDLKSTSNETQWTFFDRGLIDAIVALQHFSGVSEFRLLADLKFYPKVFFTPPWQEIYQSDVERQHSFETAKDEYDRLLNAYTHLNFQIVLLPKTSVSKRVDFILDQISNSVLSPEL